MAVARRADDLREMISTTVAIISEINARHGMIVNFKKGKSALLVQPRGEGPRKIRAELFPTADPLYETLDGARTYT
eukprot:2004510-Pyramimonas_sp.AAC.1